MTTILGIVCLGVNACRDPESVGQAYADSLRSVSDVDSGEATTLRFDGGILGVRSGGPEKASVSALEDDWLCVGDVRIDNAEDLARQLGHDVAGPGVLGASLMLAAYRAWGVQGFARLIGDFAVVLVNTRRCELVLARDAVGTRPLYLSFDRDRLLVSSELRAVVALRGAPLAIDPAEALRSLQLGGSGAPAPDRTMYAGIERVAPGSCIVWSGVRRQVYRYWDPRLIRQRRALDVVAAAEELHERLVVATVRRTKVDGPIGGHLSGGLDSSTIAAILQVHCAGLRPSPTYFSWTPRDVVPTDSSELRTIEAFAAHYGVRPVFVDGADLVAFREHPSAISQSPLYPWNSLHIEQHVQRRAQSMGIRHLMSGWGGDEAASHQGLGLEMELFLGLRLRQLYRTLSDGAPARSGLARWRALAGRAKRAIIEPTLRRLVPRERLSIASAALRRQFPTPVQHGATLDVGLSVRETQLSRYFDGYLTDRIESWYCHGKRHGLTYSYPLLDRDVLELVYSLPGGHFFHHGASRYVYRSAVERYWPDGLAWIDAKRETGLKGYFAALQKTGIGSLRDSLACFSDDPRVSRWFDRVALEMVFSRAAQSGATVDLELIARAEELAALELALANCQ